MKVFVYLLAIATMISCAKSPTSGDQQETATSGEVSNQSKPAEIHGELPQDLNNIEDIRTAYTFITSQIEHGRMDSTFFKYDCNGETGGTVTYFSDGGQVRMIKHSYYEYSHYGATDRYFVLDGKPFFVYYDQEYWSFDTEAEETGETKSNITEKRFYILDGQPVKCLEKQFTTRSSVEDGPDSESIPNQEVACSSIDPVMKGYDLLYQHRDRKEDLQCLVE